MGEAWSSPRLEEGAVMADNKLGSIFTILKRSKKDC
jgi:hypothetical protein